MADLLPLLLGLVLGLVLGAGAVLLLRRPGPPSSLAAERVAVQAMVRPLQDTLDRVSDDLARAERERAAAQAALTEQVRQTALGTDALRDQTGRLVTALRRSEVRGQWGEVTLRRLVESAGLLPHVHFEEQDSTRGDDGDLLRPDLVVDLADSRQVVVDAKVPLSSYLDAAESTDDATTRLLLARHASEVAAHVDRLSSKEYWRRYPTPEFVVLFLPAESFLSSALEARPDLLEYAFARDVVIATPTTLLALLRTVAHTWRQEAATRNVREVQRLARDLHGRLATLGGHLARLGAALDGAVAHYNSAVGSLESRVLVTARSMATLGVVDESAGDDAGLAAPRLVSASTRPLSAPELVASAEGGLATLATDVPRAGGAP
ncbi:MAG TPA: DNA recombination protein RmuC [Candidatus Nanopelagicales bacterium]|nr:DNA recombination protein RmuC [Candidatus Nanopelagicales bacterium]